MVENIRLAVPSDSNSILSIYSHYITETPITFETEVPAEKEIKKRIENTSQNYPWIVFEVDSAITGYAYASQHRTRAAYQWAVEVSIYLDINSRGKGIGKMLYSTLFKILKAQGFYKAYAGITLPNPASIGVHEYFGFRKIGVYKSVGFKMGKWHDVEWWDLQLNETQPSPAPFVPFQELSGKVVQKILQEAS